MSGKLESQATVELQANQENDGPSSHRPDHAGCSSSFNPQQNFTSVDLTDFNFTSLSEQAALPAVETPALHKELVIAAFGSLNRHLIGFLHDKFGMQNVECFLEGGCKTGHSRPIKPTSNPNRTGQEYMEIDGSIGLPGTLNPHDEKILCRVIEALNSAPGVVAVELGDKYTTDGWGKSAPQQILYAYLNVPRLGEIEIEYCLQRLTERVDVADWWNDLFTPEEVKQQILERNAASNEEERTAVKKNQCDDGRGRLLMMFQSGLSDLPEIPQHVKDLAANWFNWLPKEPPPTIAPQWVQDGWAAGNQLREEQAMRLRTIKIA